METKNFNGMRVLGQQAVDEIIAWCENDEYLTGGQVKDVEKRLSDGKDGYKDVSYKRWHFEKRGAIFGVYAYCLIDIQELLLEQYVATIEVGIKREGQEDMKYPVIFRMYESIRGINDLRRLMRVGCDIAKTGETIIRRQEYLNA